MYTLYNHYTFVGIGVVIELSKLGTEREKEQYHNVREN